MKIEPEYDYRNRVYSTTLGRFLQTDPIRFEAGDGNLYRYVGNGPSNEVDPEGLCYPRTFIGPLPCGEKYCDETPAPRPDPSEERRKRKPIPDDDPSGGGSRSSCFDRCMRENGALYALSIIGISSPAISIPYPGKKTLLGSKNKMTSGLSVAAKATGISALRQIGRRLNPAANIAAAGSAGYVAGLAASCAAICAADPTAY